MKWNPDSVPVRTDLGLEYWRDSTRLNALGSLFFFGRQVLKKTRLAKYHEEHLCSSLESEDLHLVMEQPMGHFKTTVGIALSMWWALPFTDKDEYMMRKLGYDDGWIRWMKLAHDPNTKTLITHEVEGRAIDMGKEVDEHFTNNDRFRLVFKDILPDNKCQWNDHSKFIKRVAGENIDATTGTFEYRGVGQALQGIHPLSTIQDDNMGKAAQDSMLHGDGRVLEGLLRWHRQLTTRLDTATHDIGKSGRQLVIGNRWGHRDLNSFIKENQPRFKFETHSAEGGCCESHPPGQPIFPEEWTMDRLREKRKDLGPYDYAHFYLNQSVLPEECIFKPEWIRHYTFQKSHPNLPLEDTRNQLLLRPDVHNGVVLPDLPSGILVRRMIVDLAHAKKRRRCNHVILVVGWDPEHDWFFMLDVWAEKTGYASLVDEMYKMGRRWNMSEVHLETVAAQNIMKFHLEERNKREARPIAVEELQYDNSENAKINRIESLEPIFKNSQFWCHRSHTKFLDEYNNYPASATIDVLDTLGYVPQTLVGMRDRSAAEFALQQQREFAERQSGAGGY